MIERARKRLSKRAKKGFRGWPVATVALYGPDDSTATKLTVGIVPAENAQATDLRRWFSEQQTDIRDDTGVAEEVLAFITEAGAKSVVMTASCRTPERGEFFPPRAEVKAAESGRGGP